MKFRRNRLVSLSALFLVAILFTIPSVSEASSVQCGDTITTSTTLTSNLNCNGNGLIIGANGITLDCDGYTIQGYQATGITISSKQNVTIQNCKIQNFSTGIALISSSNNTIVNNITNLNTANGIWSYSSNFNTLTNNEANSNYVGIELGSTASNYNNLDGNTANFNTFIGMHIAGSSNVLTNNYANLNDYYGILLVSANSNILTNNTANSNVYDGIILSYSSNLNILSGNKTSSNGIGIYLDDSSNTLNGNIVNSNGTGIYLSSSSSNSVLTNNTACVNTTKDIYNNGSSNSGSLNTCDTTLNWNDLGTTGCTYKCGQPKPLPVLLIHGIYSDDTIWPQVESSLASAGFQVFKVGQVLGEKGLIPNNGDIEVLAGQVQQAIQNIKATGVSKVNVIAHSMGGLATRWYISQGGYQNDIDKLITLGTPNEGAPAAKSYLAWLYGTTKGDAPADTARYQMIPNSSFLNALNSNFNTQGVQHTEIAGTDTNYTALNLMILAIQSLPPPLNFIFMQGFPISYYWQTTDTVVPEYSVNIPNITCYDNLNVHAIPLEAFGNSNAYYTDSFVISEITKILSGGSVSMNSCPPGTLKSSSSQTTNSTQFLTMSGTVNPGQTQAAVSNTSLGTKFNTFLSWTNGQLNLQFISPTSVIVDSTNYQSYPGTSYVAGTSAQGPFESFNFTQPEQGNWTVNVIGTNIGAPENYTLNLAMEKNIQLSIATDKTNYIPNDTFLITGTLTDTTSGAPVLSATVLGTITEPNNATSSLALFDDGLHNDGLANDGTYGNSYTNTSQEGVYLITVDGSISGQFQIQDTHAVFVDLQPDLSIQSQNISFNPSTLSKSEDNNVTVTATIYNIGDEDANNVEIDFYDGDPMKGGTVFATTSVSVLTGGSAQTQANLFVSKQKFGSAGAGKASGTALKDHDIHIIISSYSGFIEKDYSNNQANKLLKYDR